MKATRGPFGPHLLLSVLTVVTAWAALTAWRGFVDHPGHYLGPLAVLAAVLALSGSLARWSGLPRWSTLLIQSAVTAVVVLHQVAGSWLPTGGSLSSLGQVLDIAAGTAQRYAAPISDRVPAVWPLLYVGGAFLMLLVETLACTLRRVPAAGLGLLAAYALPSGVLDGGPDAASFIAAVVGFLALLHLDSREHFIRWGRTVGPDSDTLWRSGSALREAMRAGAAPIGVVATGLALLAPTIVPVLGSDIFHLGNGAGDGNITIRKPIADMRRDLERGEDVPLIRVRTDDPAPSYLRISVLNRFTGNEWSSGDRDVASDDVADGAVPLPRGLSPNIPTTSYGYDVDITDAFNSTWLPTQFPISSIKAKGDWRFDPATQDFLAADRGLTTRGMTYSMTALAPDFEAAGFRNVFRDATDGSVSKEVLDVPSTVPKLVLDLARQVTTGATTNYERAVLLQRFFRQDGGFTYDLRRAPDGTGSGTLVEFLRTSGRVGYCEQFASAMAVMARIVGIPARVAVGFLEPDPLGDDAWEYSSHDLHAWPELYFEGSGWVRFEPTPSGRVEDVPAYTRPAVKGGSDGTDVPSDEASPSAGSTATVAPSGPRSRGPRAERDKAAATDDRNGGVPTPLLITGFVVLALLVAGGAALTGPPAARARVRRTRLGGAADEVWTELQATATDLGIAWPAGRSPREVGTLLVERLPARTEQDALERIVLAVEQARYARPGAVATLERTDLTEDGECVIEALEAGVTQKARRRARWFPRSIWRR